jgi:hypothetical protein
MLRFLFHVLRFLIPPRLPVPLIALVLPRRLVALANALLEMVNINLLLLHRHIFLQAVFPRSMGTRSRGGGGTPGNIGKSSSLTMPEAPWCTRHTWHMGATTGNAGPRHQPGELRGKAQDDKGTHACEPFRLSMVAVESVELGVEQARTLGPE